MAQHSKLVLEGALEQHSKLVVEAHLLDLELELELQLELELEQRSKQELEEYLEKQARAQHPMTMPLLQLGTVQETHD